MSSREQLLQKAVEAVRSTGWLELAEPDHGRETAEGDVAEAALNALLPLIEEPKQMLGVPEGSILIYEVQAGARALRWENGKFWVGAVAYRPEAFMERFGPLTVVWMP